MMKTKDFQVAILYNDDSEIDQGNPQDLLAVQYTVTAAHNLYVALADSGYRVIKITVRGNLEELEDKLCSLSPVETFIFNNCDSFKGNNLGAVNVIRLIERMGFKHSGANANSIELCINKPRSKEELTHCGISTPRYQIFDQPCGDFNLEFPVIVKPAVEDASMGIDLESVVTNKESLFNRIGYVVDTYKEPAMVEAFVGGRELSIAMWGNNPVDVLPIAEEDFSWVTNPLERLLTYDSKWNTSSPYYLNIPARVPAQLTRKETQVIKNTAVASFHAMGLRDFGRVDIRFDNGIPYVIDINELPDLSPDAGFWNSAKTTGITYSQMVETILKFSLKREGWI